MRLAFRAGGSTVTLGPEIEGMVRRVVDQSGARVLDRMESTSEAIADAARKDWPVSGAKKPHSRDAIEVGAEVGRTSVATFVQIDVPYAFYIKSHKNGLGGKSPYQELIRKPGIAAGRTLGKECAADLAKLAGGRRG